MCSYTLFEQVRTGEIIIFYKMRVVGSFIEEVWLGRGEAQRGKKRVGIGCLIPRKTFFATSRDIIDRVLEIKYFI
jgi:hypothetical protein